MLCENEPHQSAILGEAHTLVKKGLCDGQINRALSVGSGAVRGHARTFGGRINLLSSFVGGFFQRLPMPGNAPYPPFEGVAIVIHRRRFYRFKAMIYQKIMDLLQSYVQSEEFIMKNTLILVALLFASLAWADCERTRTDYDVVYCGAKIYLQADKELNEAYKKLSDQLDIDGKKLLKEAQLAWIRERNQNCSEKHRSEILVDMDCAANTTIERTQFLNDRHRECASVGCMNSKLR